MKSENEIIESLVIGGVIGASLGALISNDKEKGITIGTLAGAALLATFNAHERAKKNNQPIVYEENGVIYKEFNGVKTVLRTIERPQVELKRKYKLK